MKAKFPFHPRQVELRVAHALPAREVARRAREASRVVSRRYRSARPRITWVDERHATVDLRLLGMALRVFVSLDPEEVVVQTKVPLALVAFVALGRNRVAEELSSWLSKSGRASRTER